MTALYPLTRGGNPIWWNVFWGFCQSAGTVARDFQIVSDRQHKWNDQEEAWESGIGLEDSTRLDKGVPVAVDVGLGSFEDPGCFCLDDSGSWVATILCLLLGSSECRCLSPECP